MDLTRGAVTERGAFAGCTDGRQAPAVVADPRMSDRVDTAVDVVQTPSGERPLNPAHAEAQLEQLPASDHAVLPRRKLAHPPPGWPYFPVHYRGKARSQRFSPPY